MVLSSTWSATLYWGFRAHTFLQGDSIKQIIIIYGYLTGVVMENIFSEGIQFHHLWEKYKEIFIIMKKIIAGNFAIFGERKILKQ